MISFLQPWALLALSTASIPALLHLLGRRLPPLVVFPAVRYLTATEREHSRRIRLRNLLLLFLRTLALILLALAAARPVLRIASGPSHAPTAVAVVVDNSLSSGAVVDGRLVLEDLLRSASAVLGHLDSGDRLWIVLADGAPDRVTRIEARRLLDSLTPRPLRLDLGRAVRVAAQTVQDDPLPSKLVVVLSDLQATSLSAGVEVGVPVIAVAGRGTVANRWIDTAFSDPGVWSNGGAVVARIGGDGATSTTVRLSVAGQDVARTVAAAGDQVVLAGDPGALGWLVAGVRLDPDELRADDVRHLPLFAGPPVGASSDPGAGTFVGDALEVLQQGGRVTPGSDVTLSDRLVSGRVVLFPPADPALVGGVNRALEAAGIGLQFGDLVTGEWLVEGELGTGATVVRRHRLIGEGAVFAKVGNDDWLVREGNVVLVASRMDPGWTDLPISAQFVPFLDYVISRVAAHEVWLRTAIGGESVLLPAGAVEMSGPTGTTSVRAESRLPAPVDPGVYFLRGATGDTIGALAVNPDVRESQLQPADERMLRAILGPTVSVTDRDHLGRDLFAGIGRADLAGILLACALLVVLIEFGIASSVRAGRGVR